MIYLKENIKFLRKQNRLTQNDLADRLSIKRSLIGSYEEGRGVPKLSVIEEMARLFSVSVDELLTANLSALSHENKTSTGTATTASDTKLLSILVTPDNEERIAIVPVKASAGYLSGRSNQQYMEQLPHFDIPITELSSGHSYRVFQIKGDSMLPVPPGSYVFCDYVETISDIREGKAYVIITADEGIVYKRIYLNDNNHLLLKSDNNDYEPYTIETNTILEIWRAIGFLTFELPDPDVLNVQRLSAMVSHLQEEVAKLKQ